MKQRIYIDTSIVGGYYDEEFKEDTRKLFNRLEKEEIIFVTSDLLSVELLDAPAKIRNLLNKYPYHFFEKVEIVDEAIQLANEYIDEKVVGKSSIEDCRHIALATINKVDVLASWNFKHIVNLQKIRGYNAINLLNGYSTLEIRSPKDLLSYED